jgi:hypothetical protein
MVYSKKKLFHLIFNHYNCLAVTVLSAFVMHYAYQLNANNAKMIVTVPYIAKTPYTLA